MEQVVLCFLIMAVLFDLSTDRIPNLLNVTGIVSGLLFFVEERGWEGLGKGITGCLLIFVLTLAFYGIGALRGGDGKMLCAITAMQGIETGGRVILLSLGIAAVVGSVLLCRKKGGAKEKEKERKRGRTRIHYSIPVLLAELLWGLGG